MAAATPLLWRAPAPSRHSATPSPSSTLARTHDVLASLPLAFESLGGAGFVSQGRGYSVSLSPAEAVIGLEGARFGLRPAGPQSDPAARLVGRRQLPGTVSRIQGDDPSGWTTGAPTFAEVVAEQVWPGVDVVWHGDALRLEHDVVVAPGADPGAVAFDLDGAESVTVDAGGDLAVHLGATTAHLSRPVVYQDIAGSRRPVSGSFVVTGPSRIGFEVGAYDRTAPLVIDPTLLTSTSLGGSGTDVGYSIAVDAAGSTYVTGSTESTDFPTATPLQPTLAPATTGPSTDAFVTKLSPDGTSVVWSTYLGGKGRDTGYAIAVGPGGSVYVAGVTESPDFPRVKAAQDTYGGGPTDAFVTRIAPNGSGIEWSTFLGGNQTDRARGLAVDASGNAYVTGSTSSVDFPAVNAQQPGPYRADDVDAFLAKLPAGGGPLIYSTRLGGSNDDHGLAVAVDGQGAAYVTGDTLSPGFPTVKPLQAASGGSASGVAGSFPDAFVAKFAPTGSTLVYSTFLGGSDYDQGTGIAVDGAGAAYITGSTNSPNFPTVAPLQARKDNDADAFVAKIDPTGAALVYSTYLGGGGADGGNGIAVDAAGDAYVTGTTGSTNWPTVKPVQATKNGGDDAFVVKLNPAGSALLFSTYLGGRDSDSGMSVAVDARGAVHVLGLTSSADFPLVKALPSSRPPAGSDAFVASFSLTDTASTAPGAAAGASPPAPSSTSGHDRRVRALGALTFVLLVAAGLQTVYLRKRAPSPAATTPRPGSRQAGPANRQSSPATSKGPAKGSPKASAPSGLRVLDDAGIGAGPVAAAGAPKPAAGSKAAAGAKAVNRTPKARGGPKTGGQSKAGVGPKGPSRPATPPGPAETSPVGTPPTAPRIDGPRPRPQQPAIAQLLEEDLWAAEPGRTVRERSGEATVASDAPTPVAARPPAAPDAADDARATAAVPPPMIPPVPAEELSFWDLFPEDLPPARATAFPAEDLLADHLVLPDGPGTVAGDRVPDKDPAAAPAEPGGGQPGGRPPRPPDAEIVIAELLDGPLPAGPRLSAEWQRSAETSADDVVISDLLADRNPSRAPASPGRDRAPDRPDRPDRPAPGPSADEQARIAADQARRRRARRSGGRRNPPGGS